MAGCSGGNSPVAPYQSGRSSFNHVFSFPFKVTASDPFHSDSFVRTVLITSTTTTASPRRKLMSFSVLLPAWSDLYLLFIVMLKQRMLYLFLFESSFSCYASHQGTKWAQVRIKPVCAFPDIKPRHSSYTIMINEHHVYNQCCTPHWPITATNISNTPCPTSNGVVDTCKTCGGIRLYYILMYFTVFIL